MFNRRSEEKELIDLGPGYYTESEYAACMQKLFLVNRLFGFFHSTLKLIKKFSTARTVLDVGCGNGLFLLNLAARYPKLICKGIDINSTAIELANIELKQFKSKKNLDQISFEVGSDLSLAGNSADIVLTTLVCHHLENDELIHFLKKLYEAANQAVIINDLHRHVLAYWLYKCVSRLFKNRLITHDGLISIKRGFSYKELQNLVKHAGIKSYQIRWAFPFRWRIILWKK